MEITHAAVTKMIRKMMKFLIINRLWVIRDWLFVIRIAYQNIFIEIRKFGLITLN